MRGFGKILLVAALALPAGWLVATPVGAASKTITCKTLTGTATFKPPLPTILKTKVIVTITITKAKYGGCTGAGGASGLLTYKATEKKAGNCITLATLGSSVTGPESIAWANKSTSSSTAITTKTVKVTPTNLSSFNGKISKGTLAGKTQTGSMVFVPPKSHAATGDCLTKPLSAIAIKVTAKALSIK